MPADVIKVIASSLMVSFQDRGRFGYRKLGVAPAGALDSFSATGANTLLGNLADDPVIEIGPGGFEIEILRNTWLALAGFATCPLFPQNTAREFKAGTRVRIQGAPEGLWSYLAAPGGWAIPSSFGSASFHRHSGIGTPLLKEDQLGCHSTLTLPQITARHLRESEILKLPSSIKIYPGPHRDHFSRADLTQLVSQSWQVSSHADRTGYRLQGTPIKHSQSIASLPVLVGSIQVPPSGEPIVTLHDGPTVGGYPIIGIIAQEDLPGFVQKSPHSSLSFHWHDSTPPQL